jgi:molybdopterin-guanine dinucleotide biosynthesis protein A
VGTPLPDAAGIVLAGGRSTRFGRDKLAEPYLGLPILEHTVRRVAAVCHEVVLVLAPAHDVPSLPADLPVRVARDAVEGEGPLAGVLAGLGVVGSEHALVVGGDMPDLRADVLLEMLRVAGEAPADAVALRDGERFRPLPCVLRVAPAVRRARALLDAGHRRLRDLLDATRVAVVDEPTWRALDPEGRTLFDVDVPGDLGGPGPDTVAE